MELILKNFKKIWKGLALCFFIALFCHILGKKFPVVGGAIFAILIGMIVGNLLKDKSIFEEGIKFTSKKILQYAVILLGFGMNLSLVVETGKQSLPIILATIATSLFVSYILSKLLKIPSKISTLIGVGSAICGGSAIAATAPIIDSSEEEIAQAMSVIFFFNALAALFFPLLGTILGFSTTNGQAFGIFAGTAINDTSSVTAAASTWDSLHKLGSQTLDKAVTVKLTRTLAIIPITIFLALTRVKKAKDSKDDKISLKTVFPYFILLFVLASLITTILLKQGFSLDLFSPLKNLSKFFIVMAMVAIGLNTNIIKLVKTGGKPLIMGMACWISITLVSLSIQHITNLW